MLNLMHVGSVYSGMAKRTIIFGDAFQYEPSTGDLSTVQEFGSVPLGNIGKHLSQKEVQAAIRELGRVIDEDRRSGEEGSLSPNSKGSL
jgi:hypothetical protein